MPSHVVPLWRVKGPGPREMGIETVGRSARERFKPAKSRAKHLEFAKGPQDSARSFMISFLASRPEIRFNEFPQKSRRRTLQRTKTCIC